MSISKTSALAIVCGLGLFACGPRKNPDILEVEAQLNRIKSDPAIHQHAQLELSEAQQAVTRAERDWEQRHDGIEASHLAYLAERRIDIAQFAAQQGISETEAVRLNGERKDALLDARTQDAQRAELKAEALGAVASHYQTQAELQAQTIKNLNADLQDLQAKETARGITLTLGDVLFASGKAELKPGAERKLGPLVKFLREHPEENVVIEGHTDNVGTDSFNLDLSQRRAEAVKAAMVLEQVPADRVIARGLGKEFPVTSNTSDAGRLQNRRVEIILSAAQGLESDRSRALAPR